ncbi:MAG TPA: hypothetical protein VG122_12705 [Gemmata sp.]|jgi:hypothetical protein|nr:hypothetical protein [Gemmata sp.]
MGSGQNKAAKDDNKQTPAELLKQLITESEASEKTYRQELSDDRTAEGVRKAKNKYNAACMEWNKAALDAVRKNPDLPEAFEVIATMMNRSGADRMFPMFPN